jgi:ribose transport system substrate-binding protein
MFARIKLWLFLVLVIALALPLWNCAGTSHEATEIYVLVATNIKIPYWQAAAAGLHQAAAQLKVKADVVGPERYDAKAQRDEFRRIVAKKPAGIMVSPADPELLGPEIDAAIAQGIPVVTVDSDAPKSKRLLYIGTDNYQAGIMGARQAVEQLKGKGNVIVFSMPEQTNLNDRLRGYREVFAGHPQIKIAEVINIKGDPTIAFDRTMEMMEKSPGSADAFVCMEALACEEVAEVLDRKHMTGKVVVAMDADDQTLEWVRKGSIVATVAQKPFTMAFTAAKVLDDLHHHKPASLDRKWAQDPFSPIPSFIDTGASLVNKGNLEEYVRARDAATTKGK